MGVAAAFLLTGHEVCRRFWPDALGPFERASYTTLIAILLWLGSLWITAIFGIMTAPVLAGRAIVVALAGIILWWRRRSRRTVARPALRPGIAATILLVAVPLTLWGVFILWRGSIVPPASHDALAHHLPKAVLFARAAGYESFDFLDARIRKIPANYELMLAEAILLDRSDDLTEWFSLLFYLMFGIASAAIAARFDLP